MVYNDPSAGTILIPHLPEGHPFVLYPCPRLQENPPRLIDTKEVGPRSSIVEIKLYNHTQKRVGAFVK